MIELLATSGLGTLVGMRHALEPDHLAAVSTLTTDERGKGRSALLGVCWGLGHTLSLVVVGALLVVGERDMPPRAALGFELLVAAMLVVLGSRSVWKAVRPTPATRSAAMESTRKPSPQGAAWRAARRPLLVGTVHGLAGSGALTALTFAALPGTAARLTYLALFGLGSTVGMAALSGALGFPLALLARRADLVRAITVVIGIATALLGFGWGAIVAGRS